MIFLESGTVDVSRDGDPVYGRRGCDGRIRRAFQGRFRRRVLLRERNREKFRRTCRAYAVWYGAKEGTTYNNWYITLVDNGYLTTADAVGNYYYGNILRFDLLTGSDHLYAAPIAEGTFPVQASRSGEGIWGGEGADCTSFLTEYFSGIPAPSAS